MVYMDTRKIKINAANTEAIMFNEKARKKPDPFKINNTGILWKKTVKYLGVTLNERMTLRHHLQKTIITARQLRGLFYPLINRKSKLNKDNKIRIIKSIYLHTSNNLRV